MRRIELDNIPDGTAPSKLWPNELAVLSVLVTSSLFKQNGMEFPPSAVDDMLSNDVKLSWNDTIASLTSKGLVARKGDEFQLRPEAVRTILDYLNSGAAIVINFMSTIVEVLHKASVECKNESSSDHGVKQDEKESVN